MEEVEVTIPTLKEHLDPQRKPKRILALDGGGIRGMISLGILERIERIVGAPLSDHFDLIGGTSTGALIAAKLATGSPVNETVDLYERLGKSAFRRSRLPARFGVLRAKFASEPLAQALDAQFGALKLGDAKVCTGLAIVAKRLDTGSPWVLHNNPDGIYYEPGASGGVANKNYTLKRLLQASTAAPHYFDPVNITVAFEGDAPVQGLFVDGGVSPHNNPSLLLLLLATLDGYRFGWELGADRLQIVSVGTGTWKPTVNKGQTLLGRISSRAAASHAMRSLVSMMYDASALNELLLQWLSQSPTPRQIDSEIGDLRNDLLGQHAEDTEIEPLLSYVRYDAPLEYDWLTLNLPDLGVTKQDVTELRKMDRPRSLAILREIGQAAAGLVKPEHLELAYDLR